MVPSEFGNIGSLSKDIEISPEALMLAVTSLMPAVTSRDHSLCVGRDHSHQTLKIYRVQGLWVPGNPSRGPRRTSPGVFGALVNGSSRFWGRRSTAAAKIRTPGFCSA